MGSMFKKTPIVHINKGRLKYTPHSIFHLHNLSKQSYLEKMQQSCCSISEPCTLFATWEARFRVTHKIADDPSDGAIVAHHGQRCGEHL